VGGGGGLVKIWDNFSDKKEWSSMMGVNCVCIVYLGPIIATADGAIQFARVKTAYTMAVLNRK
jgi:hypothetical protein